MLTLPEVISRLSQSVALIHSRPDYESINLLLGHRCPPEPLMFRVPLLDRLGNSPESKDNLEETLLRNKAFHQTSREFLQVFIHRLISVRQ